MFEMRDSVASTAARLARWTLLLVLLGLVVTCKARCAFSDYASDETEIVMRLCGLTTINAAELTRFTKLYVVNLGDNQLTTFPNLTAVGNTLKRLWLHNNQITDISDDVLMGLTALNDLSLIANQLTTFPNLTALGKTLKRFRVHVNQITDISDDVLMGLTAFEWLDLGSNQLTTFPNLTAMGRTLKKLRLRNNQITDISDDVLMGLTALEELFLHKNQLTTFPNLTASGKTLKTLWLHMNQITNISDDVISNLTALERLDVDANPNLTRLPHLAHMRNVRTLSIDDTRISHLPPILPENIATLRLYARRSIDVCKCSNAWLKQEGPRMATFMYDDVECGGQLWKTMTIQDMIAKCLHQRKQETKQFALAKAVPPKMSLSPCLLHSLHSFENKPSKIQCTEKCMDTPGCVSFYWRRAPSGAGECVIIAPGNSISVIGD